MRPALRLESAPGDVDAIPEPSSKQMSHCLPRLRSMAESITEFEGLQVIPPLYRTPEGWAEERPAACACGEERFLIGWAACACRTDTFAPGHRTWECLACSRRTALGCLGSAGLGPMQSYGCRTGRTRAEQREGTSQPGRLGIEASGARGEPYPT